MTRRSQISETLAETLHAMAGQVPNPVTRQRRLLAGVTAGVMALSIVLASALPVRADDDTRDLVRALAAIAVIGMIASEVDRSRDAQPVDHRPDTWHDPRRDGPRHGWQDDWHPPYPLHPEPVRRPVIPGVCAIEMEGRDGRPRAVYTESCLRDYGIDRLPRHCGREIRFYGRKDRVYSETCLRDAGFRFGGDGRGKHERPD